MRVLIKLLLRRFFHIRSFCKICGRFQHDFIVSDDVWDKVEPYIKHGYILCYDCFCEVCEKIGESSVWKLGKCESRKGKGDANEAK